MLAAADESLEADFDPKLNIDGVGVAPVDVSGSLLRVETPSVKLNVTDPLLLVPDGIFD